MSMHIKTAEAIEHAIRIAREIGREDVAVQLSALLKDRPPLGGAGQDQQ
jgi:uncharacterized protein (UPF0212 family)